MLTGQIRLIRVVIRLILSNIVIGASLPLHRSPKWILQLSVIGRQSCPGNEKMMCPQAGGSIVAR